jgi:adenosylhomocysteine nucleosidase
MTEETYSGIVTLAGGITNIYGPTAAGHRPVVNITEKSSRPDAFPGDGTGVDVGVITVIPEEARAVRHVLSLKPDVKNGLSFDLGMVRSGGRAVTVAALQSLSQGEDPAVSAFTRMREYFSPKIVVLTGIAGGIHPDVHLGDVVIATRVICYDLRKETSEHTLRRGQERQAPAEIGHAVNRFFTDHGEPAHVKSQTVGTTETIRVLEGPIGSGNAVIAHRDSEIVKYLLAFNDKILAVDMESGGLGQAHHGLPAGQRPWGWLVIRGISDHADKNKNDDYHHVAASNAAVVLRELIPYLPLGLT